MTTFSCEQRNPATGYAALNQRLIRGWNTWYVRSMMTHVRMPEAVAIVLGIKEWRNGQYLRDVLKGPQQVMPGFRSYDGSYTDMTVTWEDIRLRVQTGLDGEDWFPTPDKEKTYDCAADTR